MKFYLSLLPIYILFLSLVYSCSTEEEDTTPPPTVQQPTPEPEPPAPTQYTLVVTASEGGTVSTEGGTYDAVILAVPHDCFKELSIEKIRSFGKKECILFDVKYALPAHSDVQRL